MSMPERMEVQCPKCGKSTEMTVFQSINDSWPDAVNKILTGELFEFTCPYCGKKDHLEYDILFNDFGHKAWIQVVHDPKMIPAHADMLDATSKYMPEMRMRIVHDTYELREKVSAFVLGRDDRIIELCKYVTYAMVKAQLPGLELSWNPIYTHNPESGQEVFMLYGKNREHKIALLEEKIYNYMKDKYQKLLDKEPNRYVYNFDWAKDYLKDNVE